MLDGFAGDRNVGRSEFILITDRANGALDVYEGGMSE